jgi:hypothetical protein
MVYTVILSLPRPTLELFSKPSDPGNSNGCRYPAFHPGRYLGSPSVSKELNPGASTALAAQQ